MDFMTVTVKILIILGTVLFMISPFLMEFWTFLRDKNRKISFKRFRTVIFTVVYVFLITVLICLFKGMFEWVANLQFIHWIVDKISISDRSIYTSKVFALILLNFGVVFLFRLLNKFMRIGIEKRDLIGEDEDEDYEDEEDEDPEDTKVEKNGNKKPNRLEIKFINIFHNESWFFFGKILKYLNIVLSSLYVMCFVVYQIPALFSANWLPYGFLVKFLDAGYVLPSITLLGLWEIYFFLSGVENVDEECPDVLTNAEIKKSKSKVNLEKLDKIINKQFKNYYACDLDLSKSIHDEVSSTDHSEISKLIKKSIENDKRNPKAVKEIYLDCLDKIVEKDESMIITGSFFSEFSMYFLRYMSILLARGDNIVFVCNTNAQIDSVYSYLEEGLSSISSLYCKGITDKNLNFDNPIWKIIKIKNKNNDINENTVDDKSILVTSLNYLCSSEFEKHDKFIQLIDTVVFVDTINTVNKYNRKLAMLNTRLKHIMKNNAHESQNSDFNVRYTSHQIRYLCFDETRIAGLDKVLKNMLSIEFESVDAMNYFNKTLVRCYNYEGRADEDGRCTCPQFLSSDEEIGAVMNMAVLCSGESNVTVFADEMLPYENIAETLASNSGQISIQIEKDRIKLNKKSYNSDDYSVMIVVDSGDNLPAAIRKYMSMVSDKPALIIVFSRPYMLRDYYISNIDKIWNGCQLERIPVEEGSDKDVAQKILVKANGGGISEKEILSLSSEVPSFDEYVKKEDVNAILRAILDIYGVHQEDRIDVFKYFEYSSMQDFDEYGVYNTEYKVLLRRQGKLFDIINGRNMVKMVLGEQEILLPCPKGRLTQNYISEQNLLYEGNIYHIQKIDTEKSRIYAKLAVGGKNDEVYKYIQSREYRVELYPDQIEYAYNTKHLVIDKREDDIKIDDIFVSVFRAPAEVITKGYFEVNPKTLAMNSNDDRYHSISDEGNDYLSKQSYRRYGNLKDPYYSSDSILRETNLLSGEKGALMMSIKINGDFSDDIDRSAMLASVMLNELLHSMFPSVADSVSVCPILLGEIVDEETESVLKKQPKLVITGKDEDKSKSNFELVIIEDSFSDLGVVSVLMSSGDNVLNTLFEPILNYLSWYENSEHKSNYLYYGLDHEPDCFDFHSLLSIAKVFCDNKYDKKFVDIDSIVEYEICSFCGRKYAKGEDIFEVEGERKMCKCCCESLVGNDKNKLKTCLDNAKNFLESTYSIEISDDYKVCFESTVKIMNTLKQNRDLVGRGSDIQSKAYIDEENQVHVEYSLPSANLSELLIRELTYLWQKKHIPELDEKLAEGQIALVGIQYLHFLNCEHLARSRTGYYESNEEKSGEGYRKLVSLLLENVKHKNNSFSYLIEIYKKSSDVEDTKPRKIKEDDYNIGEEYKPSKDDRADGKAPYFYRNRITDLQKSFYDIIVSKANNFEQTFDVDDYNFNDFKTSFDCVLYDHPELFWLRNFSSCGSTVTLKYGADKLQADELQKEIDESVSGYLEGISDDMSAYDVAVRLYVKILTKVDYDTIALNKQSMEGGPKEDKIDYLRSICGIFINGKGVCEGYAKAIQYLLQKCGVECAEVCGNVKKSSGDRGGPHAWNIINIDGKYYYMDATWDDSSNTIQTVKSNDFGFDYFCITTEELLRTRDIDLTPVSLPVCNSTEANYYFHNNLLFDKYDLDRIKEIAKNAAADNKNSFAFKCSDSSVLEEIKNKLILNGKDSFEVIKYAAKANKQININSSSYQINSNIYVIKILFKYKS